MDNKEDLFVQKEKLISQINDIERKIVELDTRFFELNNEERKYRFELFKLKYDLDQELKRINMWTTLPLKSDGVIELRKEDDKYEELIGNYLICLAGKNQIIGKIDYRGYHSSRFIGDIGCVILQEFRGHNYSYRALCLLGELLKENDISDFWISASIKNIPSVKTIEKYGGVSLVNDGYSILFQANTFINENRKDK